MTRYSYLTKALDPKLLSTPCEVETDWYVLTGAACTGKTTLIDLLAEKGFQVIPESARPYFKAKFAKGQTIEDIRSDRVELQYGIFNLQLEYENGHQSNDLTFLDRAAPDCLSFNRIFGLDPNEILPDCFRYRYAGVFILDRLHLAREKEKTLGPEDALASEFLDEWLVRDYQALGYDVVRVPVLPPEDRLEFILERVEQRNQK